MAKERDLTSLTVSLSTSQEEYVGEQATAAGCSTPGEYIRRLIDADQKAHAEEALERKLLEGLNSPSREMTPKEWETLRQGLQRRQARKRKAQ